MKTPLNCPLCGEPVSFGQRIVDGRPLSTIGCRPCATSAPTLEATAHYATGITLEHAINQWNDQVIRGMQS